MQSYLTRGNRNRLQHRKCCLDVKGKGEKDVTASMVQPWDRGLERNHHPWRFWTSSLSNLTLKLALL